VHFSNCQVVLVRLLAIWTLVIYFRQIPVSSDVYSLVFRLLVDKLRAGNILDNLFLLELRLDVLFCRSRIFGAFSLEWLVVAKVTLNSDVSRAFRADVVLVIIKVGDVWLVEVLVHINHGP
jgi:hypothetical protein